MHAVLNKNPTMMCLAKQKTAAAAATTTINDFTSKESGLLPKRQYSETSATYAKTKVAKTSTSNDTSSHQWLDSWARRKLWKYIHDQSQDEL